MSSLAGLRTCRLILLAGLPRPMSPVSNRHSFLLTAAGQLRILTGFPFSSLVEEPRNVNHCILDMTAMQPYKLWILRR
jgi:hypothetical protein